MRRYAKRVYCADSRRIAASAGTSLPNIRDAEPSVDRATDSSAQARRVDALHRPEVLTAVVDRLRTDRMLLGHLGHRTSVRSPKDRDHLLFTVSALPHNSPQSVGATFSSFS